MTPSEKKIIIRNWCYDFYISASTTGRIYGMIWCARANRVPKFTPEFKWEDDMIDDAYKYVSESVWNDICLH